MKLLAAFVVFASSLFCLFLVLNWHFATSVDVSPIMPQNPRPGIPLTADDDVLIAPTNGPIVGLDAIVMRPLFSPDRRKFTPPVKPPQPSLPRNPPAAAMEIPASQVAKAPTPEFRLFGVSIGNSEPRVLLAETGTDPSWIGLGAKISDWTVQQIDANGALIENNGIRVRLDLYRSARE